MAIFSEELKYKISLIFSTFFSNTTSWEERFNSLNERCMPNIESPSSKSRYGYFLFNESLYEIDMFLFEILDIYSHLWAVKLYIPSFKIVAFSSNGEFIELVMLYGIEFHTTTTFPFGKFILSGLNITSLWEGMVPNSFQEEVDELNFNILTVNPSYIGLLKLSIV